MKSKTREVRTHSEAFRFVDGDGDKPARIEGYAALFGVESREMGFGREVIEPGAFTKTLQESDVVAYWNHDSNKPMARMSQGALELREDRKGLFASITPDDTTWSVDAVKSVRAGTVKHFSFGFRTIRDSWSTADDGVALRSLVEVSLFDVSPVADPAYLETSAAVRSYESWRGEEDDEDETPDEDPNADRKRDLDLAELEG
jgi:HK97 family phage prohead protease